jgi:transcriptional regulator with XRE-family HTH domain
MAVGAIASGRLPDGQQAGPRGQLRELVDRYYRDHDGRAKELAERAHVTPSTLYRSISSKRHSGRPPSSDTLDKLAEAMEMEPAVVHRAACVDAGYRVDGVSALDQLDAEWLLAGQGLNAKQRRSALAMIEIMISAETGEG